MFGKMSGMMDQMKLMQCVMKDENFKQLISHPKVQVVFKDPEFQEALKSQDQEKIMSFPQIAELKADPEIGDLMKKIDFKSLMS